jgi:hypothetical protein
VRDIEILNYFDTESLEMNTTVIFDLGVPYLQLPYKTLKYFNGVFFDANCVSPPSSTIMPHCYCLGLAGFSGMPNIGIRLKNYMKYDFVPKDYMSTPAINQTTNNPYCNLAIVNYWLDSTAAQGDNNLANNTGFGSIFAVKYGFYQESQRGDTGSSLRYGYMKGSFYDRFILIVDSLIWYVVVIGLLSFLVISLSWKKYDRLKKEKAQREQDIKEAEKAGKDPLMPHMESRNIRATM